jgi:hypothetical protein
MESTDMDGATLDERTLRRTIALLVALAVLAERAAVRSFPVRWLVLCILRRAEVVGQNLVIDSAPWAWPYLEDALEPGSSPADAVLLGQRLRMLAALLGALLPVAALADGWTSGRDRSPCGRASRVLALRVAPFGRQPAPHDTS